MGNTTSQGKQQVLQKPTFRVVWPLGRTVVRPIKLSSPIPSLTGKTVGFLWDGVYKGDKMFSIIRTRLEERYSGVRFVDCTVFGNTHGPDAREILKALPVALREQGCDVVISGVGA